jgi:hypothetical protein
VQTHKKHQNWTYVGKSFSTTIQTNLRLTAQMIKLIAKISLRPTTKKIYNCTDLELSIYNQQSKFKIVLKSTATNMYPNNLGHFLFNDMWKFLHPLILKSLLISFSFDKFIPLRISSFQLVHGSIISNICDCVSPLTGVNSIDLNEKGRLNYERRRRRRDVASGELGSSHADRWNMSFF